MSELPSWMPPIAGSDIEHLLGALDRMRATFRWKADGLDATGLNHRIASSELTIGGLLMHLARVEDEVGTSRLHGTPKDAFWQARPDSDDDFTSAADMEPDALYRLYDETVHRSRALVNAALADGGLDFATALTGPGGQVASMRRLLFDLLEEYGRHTGHADLLREAIDGRVGEDPPVSWEPL